MLGAILSGVTLTPPRLGSQSRGRSGALGAVRARPDPSPPRGGPAALSAAAPSLSPLAAAAGRDGGGGCPRRAATSPSGLSGLPTRTDRRDPPPSYPLPLLLKPLQSSLVQARVSLICLRMLQIALHSSFLAIFSKTEVLIIILLIHFPGCRSEATPLLFLISGSDRFLYS